MTTIWKFPLEINDSTFVTMPRGAQLLTVQTQREWLPVLWAVVDPQAEPARRLIYCRGTGHPMTGAEGRSYLGTTQDSALVFHWFDGGEEAGQ